MGTRPAGPSFAWTCDDGDAAGAEVLVAAPVGAGGSLSTSFGLFFASWLLPRTNRGRRADCAMSSPSLTSERKLKKLGLIELSCTFQVIDMSARQRVTRALPSTLAPGVWLVASNLARNPLSCKLHTCTACAFVRERRSNRRRTHVPAFDRARLRVYRRHGGVVGSRRSLIVANACS